MVGAAEAYFQAFAVYLKGTVFQVGLVSTLPIAVASLLLLVSRPLADLLGSRKRFNVAAALLRTALFVPLALTPLMGPARVWLLLGLVCLYFLPELPAQPGVDLLDARPGGRERPRGLLRAAQRDRQPGGAGRHGAGGPVPAALRRRPLYGFLLLFNLAFLGSAGSTLFLSLQHDPGDRGGGAAPDGPGGRSCGELPRSNYGRFVAFNFLLYFGTFLSSPFVVPYMLRELRLELAAVHGGHRPGQPVQVRGPALVGAAGGRLREQEDPGAFLIPGLHYALHLVSGPFLRRGLPGPGLGGLRLGGLRDRRPVLRLRHHARRAGPRAHHLPAAVPRRGHPGRGPGRQRPAAAIRGGRLFLPGAAS